jgi:hypothetical protein
LYFHLRYFLLLIEIQNHYNMCVDYRLQVLHGRLRRQGLCTHINGDEFKVTA